jgi:hypothetical protein
VKVLSLGAGVNSTALLVLKAQGKVDFDLAIFADTGGEQPETYQYIETVIKPFCQKHNIDLRIVRRDGKLLYQDYMEKKIIPTTVWRSCSDHFKIRVIRKYLIHNYVKESIVTLIGFCKGEEDRVKKNDCGSIMPLIDMGIDREGCKRIIAEAGLPIPIKSGCFFCPFQEAKSWLSILKNHPDYFAKAEALEKNGKRYPELILPFYAHLSCEQLRKATEEQRSMLRWMPKSPSCPMCEIEDNEEAKA